MNKDLQSVIDRILQSDRLSDEEKEAIIKSLKVADKELVMTSFKLSRTELVKKTTAILLEETIEELEGKRKAVEAQNKELETEAALEKVRSRSLAMHRSDELEDVVQIVFDKLKELKVDFYTVIIILFQDDSKDILWWMQNIFQQHYPKILIRYDDNVYLRALFQTKEAGNELLSVTMTGDEKRKFYNYLLQQTELNRVPDHQKKFLLDSEFATISVAIEKNTGIHITNYSGKAFSDTENETLKRFARVFEQAYIRFKDLQKAEAQAREGQIQLALERVRARTMAMQRSDELPDTSYLVFQQFEGLGVTAEQFSIGIINEEEEVGEMYATIKGDKLLQQRKISIYEPIAFSKVYNAWKSKKKNLVLEIAGDELKAYNIYRNRIIGRKVFNEEPAAGDRWIILCAFFSSGALSYASSEMPREEILPLLERFTNVFEQTYTRFLDLRKAEGQAKEAQIQLALERVRARTMAMQKSSELAEAAALLFEQVKNLGIETYASGFNIWDKEHINLISWMSNPVGGLNPPFEMPIHSYDQHERVYASWKNNELFLEDDLTGQALVKHYRFLRSFPLLDAAFSRSEKAGIKTPDRQVHNNAFFSNGYLLFITVTPLPEAQVIFQRFAKVFDQTYTRFLDLQTAEAQSRESQIQLALERVRARTMAMQKSDELSETAFILFQQFKELGESPLQITIGIFNEEKKVIEFRITGFDGSGSRVDQGYNMDIHEPVLLDKIYAAWKKQKSSVVLEITGKELLDWAAYRNQVAGASAQPAPKMSDAERRFVGVGFFSKGMLSFSKPVQIPEETIKILERFAVVFDQTYTRFLDLQKAEAQARESQIELGLERVRARSMSMYNSNELHEVAEVLFQQLLNFGGNILNAGIALCKPDSDEDEFWVSSDSGIRPKISIPHTDDPVQKKLYEEWKNKSEFYSLSKSGDELKAHYDYMLSVPSLRPFFDESVDSNRSIPAWQKWHAAYFNQGYVFLLTADEYDEEKILIRFAKIFEQAYTRFLDLQKAEVQAREAQIEAALEKVRSRSLAMYKSEEIKNVIQLVFEQLIQLNIPVHQAGFLLDYKESDDWNYWSSDLLQSFPKFIKFKYFDHPLCKRYKEVKEKGLEFSTTVLSFEDKNSLVEESYKYIHDVPEDIKQTIYSYPGFAQSGFYLNHIALYAANFEAIPFSDEHNAVLKRFALVFEQSYTRFLDLQKAEAQAREAKIEAGLERVRSKTMAMHNSNDVGDTVVTMFDELVKLDIETLRCGVGIMQEGIKMELWTAKQDDNGKTGLVIGFMDMKIHPLLRGAYHGWESKKEDFSYVLQGDDVAVYFNAINNYPGYPVTYDLARVPATVFHHDFYFREGTLFVFTQKELTPENAQVLKRFSAVFGQTYRRYQDLKKAEAQAREAQIEASLEKVRSSAMSMHNSNDIAAATNVMFAELHKLEIQSIRCGVVLLSKSSHTGDLYAAATSSDGEFYTLRNTTRMTLHPSLIKQYESWLTQEMYVSVLTGEELRSYYQLPFFSSSVNYARPENYDRTEYGYYIPFSEGLFYAWTFHPYSEKEKNVLERFKNIIELTFRRFLDLQKAEAQAREAQIEAALERVRSRSIGMQKSDELKEVIQIVYEQFGHLNIHVEHTGFLIDYKTRDDMHIWLADKHLVPSEVTIPWFDSPPNNSIRDAKEKGKDFFSYQLTFEEKNKFYRELFKFVPGVPEETLEYFLTCPGLAGSGVLLENIGLYIENFSGTPYSVEGNAVLMRFGKVFQQTYTRFLDLQKAEAQAREARIEAALERVRSRTMAMQRSEELLEAGELLYKELTGLGIQSLAINYSFIDAKEENSYAYGINPVDGKLPPKPVLIPLTETDPMRLILSSWKKQQPVFRLELNEEDTLTHQTWIANILYEYFKSVELPFSREDFLTYHSPKNIVLYAFNFKEGYIFSAGGIKLTSSEEQLVSRFTKVFQQTYTRFLDLQKAEAQALEAIKRASVDRVRAEIASMRTTNDLERITPLIWNELTTLGVPFIRCGVFIMDEDQQQVQSFLSTPDGKAIAAFRLPYNSPGEIAQIVEHWHRKKMYKQHWNESQFIEFTQNLVQQGAVTSGEKYLTENRPTDLYLHFLPFLQGMLYAGNTAALSDDELQLVQNLADAFSTAYARYEDFNKLEAAKKQVDSTLNELQATQKQLIQSEKMASLGELTAGIAHEIQNPLNFVNNFSDVNKELLAELKEEIEKGNYEEVKVIAADIAGNEEKISHHGKRADSIVKGMLQHSRSTSPTKEPTDINALADEYLRLAYHGLRAKDKSFNATMNTSYDETMGKVGVIPQDIGRVILNVITNAFYTVNEKKNKLGDGYEPAVSMITKKMADGIEIRITDNGNGIPQKVVEKIFQPFFTTKPTGKGTGLGLSLAYDIVKAHNGEIKAETTEGVGTTFIIQLPVT